MPVVDPNMPEPLKTAMEAMERDVQAFKTNLSYQAPEVHRELWIELQENLVDAMVTLYNSTSIEPYKAPD